MYSNPCSGLDRPLVFQEVKGPTLQNNRHMKVVSLSGLRAGHFVFQEIFRVLISVWDWVDLSEQCLNHLRQNVPLFNNLATRNCTADDEKSDISGDVCHTYLSHTHISILNTNTWSTHAQVCVHTANTQTFATKSDTQLYFSKDTLIICTENRYFWHAVSPSAGQQVTWNL
jgi:hypothetical protein